MPKSQEKSRCLFHMLSEKLTRIGQEWRQGHQLCGEWSSPGKRVLVDLSERLAEGKMKWSDLGGGSNRIWWIGGEGAESKMTLGF